MRSVLWSVVLLAGIPSASNAAAPVGEPAACLSPNPGDWPARSKPYFLVIADSSASMTNVSIPTANSCGFANTQGGHLKCALRNAFLGLPGVANFGLATFAVQPTACDLSCNCSYVRGPNDPGGAQSGCGAGSGATRAGLNIVVPIVQDNFWTAPPNGTNATSLLSWVDNSCNGNTELFGDGSTPINGALRDAKLYLSSQWTSPFGSGTLPTPIASPAVGERGCRSVNVIIITDGGETCDTNADAVNAAAALFAGVTIGGQTFNVRTHVVTYGDQANMDAVAAAGGTGSARAVSNSAQITDAINAIVLGTLGRETCDNADNDCNGCTDEGFRHYCNTNPTCCAWGTPVQRATCLATFQATITAGNPQGDQTKLPCTTAAQASTPASWLCYDPGDTCDETDNNCVDGVDNGKQKCGNPLHCPSPEVCNGLDDNCNGQVDDGASCPGGQQCVGGTCVP